MKQCNIHPILSASLAVVHVELPLAVAWLDWMASNRRTFEDKALAMEVVFCNIKSNTVQWELVTKPLNEFSIHQINGSRKILP